MARSRLRLTIVALLLGTGCATVSVDGDHKRLAAESMKRTGHAISWEQTSDEKARTQHTVLALLHDGLTRKEAERIALLNNRSLQSDFELLGIARADVVQAGLYTNPTIGTLLRFPFGGANGVDNETDVLVRLSDLWTVPLRRKIAEVDALRVTHRVEAEILKTVAAARDAFDDVLFQDALLAFATDNIALFKNTLDATRVRFHAGLVNDLDIYLAEAMLHERELELAQVQAGLNTAHTRLRETLGLDPLGMPPLNVTGNLEDLPSITLTATEAWEYAQEHRVELRLARLQIEQTQRLLTLQKRRIFGNVDVGGNYTREFDGVNLAGPVLALQLPIFDQNQAGIARTEFQLRRAQKQLAAAELEAKQETRRLLGELGFHHTHVAIYRDKMLVAQEKAESYVTQFFSSMQLNAIYLIEARQRILDTRRGYLHALREYRQTASHLQVALGGRIPLTP